MEKVCDRNFQLEQIKCDKEKLFQENQTREMKIFQKNVFFINFRENINFEVDKWEGSMTPFVDTPLVEGFYFYR